MTNSLKTLSLNSLTLSHNDELIFDVLNDYVQMKTVADFYDGGKCATLIEQAMQLIFNGQYSNINVQDENGNTFLHLATRHYIPAVILYLLKNGANPFIINKKHYNCFQINTINQEFEDLKKQLPHSDRNVSNACNYLLNYKLIKSTNLFSIFSKELVDIHVELKNYLLHNRYLTHFIQSFLHKYHKGTIILPNNLPENINKPFYAVKQFLSFHNVYSAPLLLNQAFSRLINFNETKDFHIFRDIYKGILQEEHNAHENTLILSFIVNNIYDASIFTDDKQYVKNVINESSNHVKEKNSMTACIYDFYDILLPETVSFIKNCDFESSYELLACFESLCDLRLFSKKSFNKDSFLYVVAQALCNLIIDKNISPSNDFYNSNGNRKSLDDILNFNYVKNPIFKELFQSLFISKNTENISLTHKAKLKI